MEQEPFSDKQQAGIENLPKKPNWKTPVPWFATWFGCGLLSPAPGTWGTIGGFICAIAVYLILGLQYYILIGVGIILLGIWASTEFGKQTGIHDAGNVVIDEVAGIWIALIPAFISPLWMGISFFTFRALDIWKPGPIGWCDRELKAGTGVMMDDILAGLISALIILGGRYVTGT